MNHLEKLELHYFYDYEEEKVKKQYCESIVLERKTGSIRIAHTPSEAHSIRKEQTLWEQQTVEETLNVCAKLPFDDLEDFIMEDSSIPHLRIRFYDQNQMVKEVTRAYAEDGVTTEVMRLVCSVEKALLHLDTSLNLWIYDDDAVEEEWCYYCQVVYGPMDDSLHSCHSYDEEVKVGDYVKLFDEELEFRKAKVVKVERYQVDRLPEAYMQTPPILEVIKDRFEALTVIDEKDFEGNDQLEERIQLLNSEETKENFDRTIQMLQNQLHAHCLIPVIDEEEGEYSIRNIQLGEQRDNFIAVFTSFEQMEPGEATAYISDEIYSLFCNAMEMEEITGVVINPWTDPLLLSKELLAMVMGTYVPIANRIFIERGDITKLECDCIVNAANQSLLGGGGVDGAIHKAAGPQLVKECATLHGCKPGEAKITGGYDLYAKYVIHTVGPIYFGTEQDAKTLTDCYWNSLELAKEYQIHTIAFPAISTGVYGYPLEEAVPIAIQTVQKWLDVNEEYGMGVIFSCFDQNTYDVYMNYYQKMNDFQLS